MGRNVSGKLLFSNTDPVDLITLPAASTINLDVLMNEVVNGKGIIQVIYSATAATTGITTTIFYGIGKNDDSINVGSTIPCRLGTAGSTTTATAGTANATFSSNSDTITMATVTTNQSSTVVKNTYFYFADAIKINPRWQRFQFTNLDATNSCQIRFFVEV